MSYRFIKIPDGTNPYDTIKVEVSLETSEITYKELVDLFITFSKACTFQEGTINKYVDMDGNLGEEGE